MEIGKNENIKENRERFAFCIRMHRVFTLLYIFHMAVRGFNK